MGNIKIEFELPEFQSELTVSVTLRRDGETIVVSPSSTEGVTTVLDSGNAWKQGFGAPIAAPVSMDAPKKKTVTKKSSTPKGPSDGTSGNMMDMSF